MAVLNKIFHVVFLLCFALVTVILFLQNGMIAGLLVSGAAIVLCYRSRFRRFSLALFLACLLTRFLFVLLVQTPVVSDFQVMLTSARQWAQGDLTFAGNIYYQLWGYQLPFTGWQALLLRIWDNELILKVSNCLFMAGSNVLVYRLARVSCSEGAARAAGGLYFFLLFPASLSSVLTNQHMSAFFLLLAMALLLVPEARRLKFWRFPLAGLSAATGHAIRSEGTILLAALAAYLIFWLFQRREALLPRLRRALPRVAAFLLIYALILTGLGTLMNTLGVSNHGIGNDNPLWKFVCGLNYETGGTYSKEDATLMFSHAKPAGGSTPELEALEKDLILQRLSVPPTQLAGLMFRKIQRLWTTVEFNWAFGHWDRSRSIGLSFTYGDLLNRMIEYEQGVRTVLYLLALLGVWSMLRQGRGTLLPGLLPALAAFASFCAFLLVEVQGRYCYLPLLFLACTAGPGIQAAAARFSAFCSSRRTAEPGQDPQ